MRDCKPEIRVVTITKQQTGFTLIELAVVVFLIGLLASMGFGTFKAQMMNAAIRATQGNQGAIKDALMAYLAKNKRLPCPATSDVTKLGQEGRDTTPLPPNNCFTYYGLVPYQELGLTKSTAMDGWDNFFSYGVSPKWTATYSTLNDQYNTTSAANSFNVGVPGVIIVNDRNQTSGAAMQITSTAVAVVISQGVNGYGAYTSKGTQNDASVAGADELANKPPATFSSAAIPVPPTPPTYFKRDYTSNTSAYVGAFDDVVLVLNSSDLLTPLMRDGTMKSAQGQWADQVTNIKNWVADYAAENCAVPTAIQFQATTYATGPWGETITYTPTPTATLHFTDNLPTWSHTTPTTSLYRLTDSTAIPVAPNTLDGPTAGWLLMAYPYLTTKCP